MDVINFFRMLLIIIVMINIINVGSFTPISRATQLSSGSKLNAATIGDLYDMNVKEAIIAVCGDILNKEYQYTNTDILKSSPSICKYIIGNPKAFLSPDNTQISSKYGVIVDKLDMKADATTLSNILPGK